MKKTLKLYYIYSEAHSFTIYAYGPKDALNKARKIDDYPIVSILDENKQEVFNRTFKPLF